MGRQYPVQTARQQLKLAYTDDGRRGHGDDGDGSCAQLPASCSGQAQQGAWRLCEADTRRPRAVAERPLERGNRSACSAAACETPSAAFEPVDCAWPGPESFSTGFASRSTVGVMLAANKIDNMVPVPSRGDRVWCNMIAYRNRVWPVVVSL